MTLQRPKMKTALLLILALLCSCLSPQIHVLSQSSKNDIENASVALYFPPNSIAFYFDRPMLSSQGFRSPSGIQFDSTMSPKENFKELFLHYASTATTKFPRIKTLVLSKKIDTSSNTIVTQWDDSITVPTAQSFIRDYSEIDYALIFDSFQIIYTDCGTNYTSISGKCVPELEMVVQFKLVSNRGDGLVQYGIVKQYYEYVRPQSGMLSKPDPNFLNVRYAEWESLIKLVFKKIVKSGPLSG